VTSRLETGKPLIIFYSVVGVGHMHEYNVPPPPPPTAGRSLLIFPSPAGTSLFPARESLVSDIPPGDWKTANHFLQCIVGVGHMHEYNVPHPTAGRSLLNFPSPAGTSLFPARESSVSDIPAGDGKTANLFFTV
jgi:hypothetical protein